MSRYRISPDAIRDLEGITDYFAIHNVEVGEQFLQEFRKKCRYLTQFPLMGRSYAAIRPGLRGVPINRYILFYRVMEEDIEIVRVVRGDRDLEALFEE